MTVSESSNGKSNHKSAWQRYHRMLNMAVQKHAIGLWAMRDKPAHHAPLLGKRSRLQRLAIITALAVTCAPDGRAMDTAAPYQSQSCTLTTGPSRTVARIIDGETVQLDDGSSVRLIGALAPRAGDAGAAHGAWPAEQSAIATLTKLVLGQTVKLAFDVRHTDRYGRHLAHLFLNRGGIERWVQGELLSSGAVRAYGLPGTFACSAELLAHEHVARDTRRGLWGVAVYRPIPAQLTGLLMSRRSRYQIVEGAVASVSRAKSAVYLNFGSDWKSDFTARIAKDVLSAHPEFNQRLDTLKDMRVAVRGWIERRNGPMIDISDPSQLEILDRQIIPPALSGLTAPSASKNASAPSASQDTGTLDAPNEKRPAFPDAEKPGALDL